MASITVCGMDHEYRDLYESQQPAQSADTADGDPLWPVASQQNPSTPSMLHELIQNPQTHTADTQQLLERADHLIQQYPHLLVSQDNQRKTALDLILIQLQRSDLTAQGRDNLEALKTLLDTWYSTIKRAAM